MCCCRASGTRTATPSAFCARAVTSCAPIPKEKNGNCCSAGLRNTYDFDFNAEGEMFAFDSDMEWDWGTPWYRPTRIVHCVSGGEYGWRAGTGKWPELLRGQSAGGREHRHRLADGREVRHEEQIPGKISQRALCDGLVLRPHSRGPSRHPNGASYTGEFEKFVQRQAAERDRPRVRHGRRDVFHHRRTRNAVRACIASAMSAKRQTAETRSTTSSGSEKAAAKARELRHKLETFHGKQNPKAVDFRMAAFEQRRPIHPLRRAHRHREPASERSGRTAR